MSVDGVLSDNLLLGDGIYDTVNAYPVIGLHSAIHGPLTVDQLAWNHQAAAVRVSIEQVNGLVKNASKIVKTENMVSIGRSSVADGFLCAAIDHNLKTLFRGRNHVQERFQMPVRAFDQVPSLNNLVHNRNLLWPPPPPNV
jgi:hypothetical protein